MTAEIMPIRTEDPVEALRHLTLDGAAVLTGCRPDFDGGFEAATAVLGDAALELRTQLGITREVQYGIDEIRRTGDFDVSDERFGPVVGAQLRTFVDLFSHLYANDAAAIRHDAMLPPHVDGYAIGEQLPDYIFQVMIRPCPAGGASVLVDAAALSASLDEDTRGALAVRSFDLTEPGFLPWHGPVLTTSPTGRVRHVVHPYVTIEADTDTPEHDARVLASWMDAVHHAIHGAQGFRLEAGDVLCIDNFRVCHSRQPFVDTAREMHVCWAWTRDAFAIPPDDIGAALREAAEACSQ